MCSSDLHCSVRLCPIQSQTAVEQQAADSPETDAAPTADLSVLTPANVLTREYQRLYAADPPAELLQALHEILQQEELSV